MSTMIRTYSELVTLPTFEERFKYLKLDGVVGAETFGYDRYLNQQFYQSQEWKSIRDKVIIRDYGRDLASAGHEIVGRIYIHHMNPVTKDDVLSHSDILVNPEYLICTCKLTHDAIHYGDEHLLPKGPVIRRPNDTCPWKGGTLWKAF